MTHVLFLTCIAEGIKCVLQYSSVFIFRSIGKNSAEIFRIPTFVSKATGKFIFFWGGGIENDYRKMSTDGRNVNVLGVIPQLGAMYLTTSSVHVLTVRCAARDTGRPTRNANTLSLNKTLPYGRN